MSSGAENGKPAITPETNVKLGLVALLVGTIVSNLVATLFFADTRYQSRDVADEQFRSLQIALADIKLEVRDLRVELRELRGSNAK